VNFFLDENFPRKAIPILKAEGHKVFDLRGTEREGCSDIIIFEEAMKQKAVFLTTDKDFYHTIHFLYENHYGIIVIALSQPDAASILSKLRTALGTIQKMNIHSTSYLLTDQKIYYQSQKGK
jgi:predicted nuclease of predicted toxin-antitoxin system